ncbi:hypothetical protein AB0A73_21440 [Glycomyces sp. NPDC047369]
MLDDHLDLSDAETGKTRVCARMCLTCTFQPDRQRRFPVSDEVRDDAVDEAVRLGGVIVCHESLPEVGAAFAPAICRGFWIQQGSVAASVRLIREHGDAVFVQPPQEPPPWEHLRKAAE